MSPFLLTGKAFEGAADGAPFGEDGKGEDRAVAHKDYHHEGYGGDE